MSAEVKPPWRKMGVLALVVIGLLAVVYLSPLREWLGRLKEVSEWVKGLGFWAPLIFTLTVAVLVSAGVPRLIFCFLAGMTFGFWTGLLWAQLGTLLGSYGVFLLTRSGGRDWAQRYLSKRGKLRDSLRQEGTAGVIFARQLPVPGMLVNLACGLFAISHRQFLVGTALGQLPEAVPCTLIGAGTLGASFSKSLGLISLAVAAAVVLWVGLRLFLRWQRPKSIPLAQ